MPQCRHVTLLFDILQFIPQGIDLHTKFFLFVICMNFSQSASKSTISSAQKTTHQVSEVV